eukprot:TRINITY_DN13801_c0_g1_i1.p1 TRINITY_DN13801_c0_g1~~TRINITY_DN13801_c0_g1_i1.p1  ORF type:complete len:398 (+),score=94.53 TRINITY_DN13801_c0_g1_i1:94-1287(+)
MGFYVDERIKQVEQGSIDWATSEAIAVGSLLAQGYNVRFAGQDVERGTFSHRHFVLKDQRNENKVTPFSELPLPTAGRFQVANSPLSEASILGFEWGYASESPQNLVIWEAQFGDFFNTAQTVIDTYITSGEHKWLRQTGLVLLLPHGMDGAGPEHSSCRIERFLQLGNSDGGYIRYKLADHNPERHTQGENEPIFYETHQDLNFHFAYPTTPSNYFHLLRRQMLRNYRKPLIVASPKTLLRHAKCVSTFEDIAEGTAFKPILAYRPKNNSSADVKKVIVATGKIYYEVLEKFGARNNFVLINVEELMPFPEKALKNELSQLGKDSEVIYLQEEHMNAGAFTYIEPRLRRIMRELNFKQSDPIYIGRRALGAPAVGYQKRHKAEVDSIFKALDENLK